MAYVEFGYEIDDIDKLISDHIKMQQLTIPSEGMNVNIKTIITTPEEVYAKRTIPCIAIESGFTSETPWEWIKEPETELISDTDGKNLYETEELVTIYYTYKIGYYVTDPRASNYLFRALSSLLPVKFTLPLVKGDDEYCIAFLREPNVIKLDEVVNGVRIYRRDFILKTTLTFAAYLYEDYLQAAGVDIQQIIL